MGKLVTENRNALRFLMTEDVYDLGEEIQPLTAPSEAPAAVPPVIEPAIRAVPSPAQPSSPAAPTLDKADPFNISTQPASFNYLGENNRYFLIIVNDKSHPSLNTPHKEMLMKIMGAKKLELRDLAILNLAKYPDASFAQLKDFFSCSKVALFGIDPKLIGLPAMSANQPGKHHDVKVLATFSLEEMSGSTDKKKEFWNVMKDF